MIELAARLAGELRSLWTARCQLLLALLCGYRDCWSLTQFSFFPLGRCEVGDCTKVGKPVTQGLDAPWGSEGQRLQAMGQ